MNARKCLSLAAVSLWCVALFLPCCAMNSNRPAEPGWMGVVYAVWAIPWLYGIPPLVANYAVLWAAIEAAAGRAVATRGGGMAVAAMSGFAMLVSYLTLRPMFAWGAYVWVLSVVLACVSLLIGGRVTWRELDGPAADMLPRRKSAGQDFGTTKT